MTKSEKLIKQFELVRTFPWNSLLTLMKQLGFQVIEGAGSRVKFIKGDFLVSIHRPHPEKELKAYAIKQIKQSFEDENLI